MKEQLENIVKKWEAKQKSLNEEENEAKNTDGQGRKVLILWGEQLGILEVLTDLKQIIATL